MREPGFYWISRKEGWEHGRLPQVAKWDGKVWWTVGYEQERDDDEVTCLSPALVLGME